MSKVYYEEYVEVTMHKFKTHLAHYTRMLETWLYRAIVVKRGKKPVGVYLPIRDREKD